MSKRECIEKLSSYRDEIEEIISLLEGNSFLRGADKKHAQELLKNLKQKLKKDYELHDKVRSKKLMSDIEESTYLPAINKAYLNIKQIKSNSIPGQKWFDLLDNAKYEIDFYLEQL